MPSRRAYARVRPRRHADNRSDMALYEIKSEAIVSVAGTSFGEEHVRERGDLQRLLRANINVVCPDTMVLAEEFCDWDDSRRRIDLLGLDKSANLVVVELKRSEDGGHMDLQAIRYAAMVSTMTFDQAVTAHTGYLTALGRPEDARAAMLDFLGWDEANEEAFGREVRIVLVSAEFSKELTTAVLWLNDHSLKVRCVRLKPYNLDGRVLVDVQQIIPLPEAEDYTVRVSKKEQQQKAARDAQRDYTKFDVTINGVRHERLSKRKVMLVLIRRLVEDGVPPEKIAAAVPRRGDRLFRSAEGKLDPSAFLDQVTEYMKAHGKAFDPDRYFCETEELLHVGGRTYAVTNQWGAGTQETVEALLTAFGKHGITIEPASEA
jgi:hypothetical protein